MLSNQRSLYRKSRYPQFGLQLWLDVSVPENFVTDETGHCSLAKDRTGNQRDFTSLVGTTYQPLYVLGAINGLPALRFDGTANYMDFADPTLSWLNNSSFTIIYVATKTGNTNSFVFGGQATGNRNNLGLGYLTSTTYRSVFGNDDINALVPAALVAQPELYTITYDETDNSRFVRRNGTVFANDATDGPLSGMSGQAIGRYLSTYGQFDLGEILIYNRVISEYERVQIERDLFSKWTIS